MTQTILWVYIGFLLAGGLMGYFLGKSKISLFMSGIFAVLLTLCAEQLLPSAVSVVALALLLIVFFHRLRQTKKFMPAGLMLVITLLTLVLLEL